MLPVEQKTAWSSVPLYIPVKTFQTSFLRLILCLLQRTLDVLICLIRGIIGCLSAGVHEQTHLSLPMWLAAWKDGVAWMLTLFIPWFRVIRIKSEVFRPSEDTNHCRQTRVFLDFIAFMNSGPIHVTSWLHSINVRGVGRGLLGMKRILWQLLCHFCSTLQ